MGKIGAAIADEEAKKESDRAAAEQERERREELAREALGVLRGIVERLFEKIQNQAPTVKKWQSNVELCVEVGQAKLRMVFQDWREPIPKEEFKKYGWDVILGATIVVEQDKPRYVRSSSLWYSDVQEGDGYRWREVSYFRNALYGPYPNVPCALDFKAAAEALSAVVGKTFLVAWGPHPIDDEEEHAFFDRWAMLLADACKGKLSRPRRFPLE